MSKEYFTEDKIAEWLMGQFLSGYENNEYLGYNACINISHSFLNHDYYYHGLKERT